MTCPSVTSSFVTIPSCGAPDLRLGEFILRILKPRLCNLQIQLCQIVFGLGVEVGLLANKFLGPELFLPMKIPLGPVQPELLGLQAALRLVKPRLKAPPVQLKQQLPALHGLALLDVERDDTTAQLGLHNTAHNRKHLTGGGDDKLKITLLGRIGEQLIRNNCGRCPLLIQGVGTVAETEGRNRKN